MRIAVIGGGISGLSAAWMLSQQHSVTVFEAEPRPGGHSRTIQFSLDGQNYAIDVGFIVYNDRTYPLFMELLQLLGVPGVPTEMSFAVRCDRTGVEYSGTSLNGLFAQRSRLLSPSFIRMVIDILRFNSLGTTDADFVGSTETVGQYLRRRGFGNSFKDHYLLPMGAAIWSCPMGTFADFPIQFILEFYRNHGLLSLTRRPQWYTIPGGSRNYVSRLIQPFADRIVTDSPVRRIRRTADAVTVITDTSEHAFDEVVIACHSDQALALLEQPTPDEIRILSGFPYSSNDVVLHTDESVLPRSRRAWSAWNYRVAGDDARATVTYNMNILQHIQSPHTFCVTLNDTDSIRPEKIISRHRFSHPIFTTERAALQQQHSSLIRASRTSFCGAWWGNGFHEDGVRSALAVCRQFGIAGLTPTAPLRLQSASSPASDAALAVAGG
ncbi:MAG: NAD(P)/FAD-dependent oxidoreductase [Planctomycetaceae bacterium]